VRENTKQGYVDIAEGEMVDMQFMSSNSRRGRRMENKVHTLTQVRNNHYVFENGDLRYLTQTELERAQTLPEGYTKVLTRDKAAGCIGDGWTVDVIVHLFQGMGKILTTT